MRLLYSCLLFVATWSPVAVYATDASLQPIVIGGDRAEPREPSSCDRQFGDSPVGAWINGVVHALCKQGDATSLSEVFLFTAPGLGGRSAPDWATLDRAFEVRGDDAVVPWMVALLSKCKSPLQASECPRMMVAAEKLTHRDPDNAMAWLTLAFAADRNLANPADVSKALERANAAPRFHDYQFDLTKRVLHASGRIPVPAEIRGAQSEEQFRVVLLGSIPSLTPSITDWVAQGCTIDHADPAPAAEQCAKVREQLFRRGDSQLTDSGDAKASMEMKAAWSVSNTDGAAVKSFVAGILASSNEYEFALKMKTAH